MTFVTMFRPRRSAVVLIAATLGLWPGTTSAQVINREYEIKAKYLYFLAAFVQPTENPPTSAPDPNPKKRIAYILRPNTTVDALFTQTIADSRYRTLKLDGRPYTVEWVPFANVAEFEKAAHESWAMVFLLERPRPAGDNDNPDLGKDLEQVNKALNRKLQPGQESRPHVLVVTDQNDSFKRAADVNFYEDNVLNRVRIQIRGASLKGRKLVPDPKFLANDAVKYTP
jgi:hypothetical protein